MSRKQPSPTSIDVPVLPWRDAEARMDAQEESARRALRLGVRMARIVRKPE